MAAAHCLYMLSYLMSPRGTLNMSCLLSSCQGRIEGMQITSELTLKQQMPETPPSTSLLRTCWRPPSPAQAALPVRFLGTMLNPASRAHSAQLISWFLV